MSNAQNPKISQNQPKNQPQSQASKDDDFGNQIGNNTRKEDATATGNMKNENAGSSPSQFNRKSSNT